MRPHSGRIRVYFVTIAVLLVAGGSLRAQTAKSDSSDREISVPRLALVGGATAGAFVYGHAVQANIWWKGAHAPFHFEWDRDWRYSLGADKLGHLWFPYIVGRTYGELLTWCGLDSGAAIWTAASLALAYQSYIEVRDGFSADWGFSMGDFGADVIGAALPVLQYYVPDANVINLKLSFFPSERMRAGLHGAIIDDYESSWHWVSFRMKRLLPADWRDGYPGVVDLALGHSVRDLDGIGGGTHQLYIALDWNLDEILLEGWAWDVLRGLLRHYHLPAPSLRFYPGPLQVGFVY